MANNIEDTLLVRLSMSDMFAVQLDESTDISKKAIMLCFVRFLWEDQILEDFLFSCELLHTTAADIFTALNDFFNKHDVTWTKCVGLSTDGAKSMAGHKAGLQARVKAVAPEVKWIHCCVHREALVAKTLPEPLQKVLNEVVQIVNYIKPRPLQSRLFSLLCKEISSEHEHLFTHTELCSTAYLADVFKNLNVLNLSLQGKNVDIFKVKDKISAMVKKCQLWAARIENESFTNFSNLKQFLESAEQSLPDPIKINAAEHLCNLATTFRIYFPEPDPDDG
ncbi:zinc finger BED domain-containing protein 5-like [Diabrotica undecimpunctata]|uniref:zinc finger BED domain-containing protein 5-like n=1 Tax=Diabrotica undecimpunctata TaxID=50387 RepID=UPI003B632420